MSENLKKAYEVRGMTCGHCEAAVTEAVEQVAGVTSARADRAAATVAVTGEGFREGAIRGAIAEAGYEVVGS